MSYDVIKLMYKLAMETTFNWRSAEHDKVHGRHRIYGTVVAMNWSNELAGVTRDKD
jgi:hypothetical protein